jgi:hypothetical protein
VTLPYYGGLPLVSDAHAPHLRGNYPGLLQDFMCCGQTSMKEFLRVMLYPSGLRKYLGHFLMGT